LDCGQGLCAFSRTNLDSQQPKINTSFGEKMAEHSISFLNWQKFNPRTDVKKPGWFRFDNSLLDDPQFFNWSGEEIKALLYLFCQASKKNNERVIITEVHAERVCLIKPKHLQLVLQKLEQLQMIQVSRYAHDTRLPADVTCLPATVRTERNGTERDGTERAQPERLASAPEIFSGIAEVLTSRGVSVETQHAWSEAYPEADWICGEVRKAIAWETANPSRRKKNFGKFMTNWLNSGWDKRRLPPLSGGYGTNYAEKRSHDNRVAADEYLKTLEGVKNG
jgi:hypothetical protein